MEIYIYVQPARQRQGGDDGGNTKAIINGTRVLMKYFAVIGFVREPMEFHPLKFQVREGASGFGARCQRRITDVLVRSWSHESSMRFASSADVIGVNAAWKGR